MMKMQTYFKLFISIVSITMALGMGVQIAGADTRTGNLSVYLLIDKSLSMKQEIGSVNNYLEQFVCNNLLQTGDFVYALSFYGGRQQLFQGRIGQDITIEALAKKFRNLKADRHYTDIGSALDTFEQAIQSSATPPTEQHYILLLSDNYHEGPPGSPYPGKTYDLDHHLLQPKKEIPMNGWQISILGITVEEKARRLATEITNAWNQSN